MPMARQRSKPQVNKYGTLYFNVTVPEELAEQTISLFNAGYDPVSYTHLRAHETPEHLVCRLLLEKKK